MFGTEGNGFKRGIKDFDFERFLVAASDYGVALCAFEDAARYANVRVQFGKPIGRFQLNQLKFAEMAIKLTAMKNMVYEAAWHYDTDGIMTARRRPMCKYYCVNAAFSVVDDAMQVMAGVGGRRRPPRPADLARPAGGPGQRRHRRNDDPHRGQGRPARLRELKGSRPMKLATDKPSFGVLDDVKVVYAAVELAVPKACCLMAEWGADVTWLENTGAGDTIRDTAWIKQAERRNQRSVCHRLLLRRRQGGASQLLADADVFVESSKGGTGPRRASPTRCCGTSTRSWSSSTSPASARAGCPRWSLARPTT